MRDVGAYAGLCPRRDQSGGSPEFRICKRGRLPATAAGQRRPIHPGAVSDPRALCVNSGMVPPMSGPSQKTRGGGGGSETLRSALEPCGKTTLPIEPLPQSGQPPEDYSIRNDCDASPEGVKNFDNQMATFHPFAVNSRTTPVRRTQGRLPSSLQSKACNPRHRARDCSIHLRIRVTDAEVFRNMTA